MQGRLIRSSSATAIRYERKAPREPVHMDVKKLGRIPEGGCWRANGRQNGQTGAQKWAGIGYSCVRSLIDDCTRLAYSEILDDEKGVTYAGFLAWAAACFAERSIPRIGRVMTDIAFAYKSSIGVVIADFGAKQVFIKPHCPWQNRKAPLFNRNLATEWAYPGKFSRATRPAGTHLRPSSSITTMNDATPRSAANLPSAGCNQCHDGGHLDADADADVDLGREGLPASDTGSY